MKLDLNALLTTMLVACALLTTGIVVQQKYFSRSIASTLPQKPEYLRDWKAELAHGVLVGPPQAPVQLIEFADFECPYCASFHKTLKDVRERYPAQVALTYVHFPLPMHRFAEPAARVADCASEQRRFDAMYDQLFEGQGQLGLKPWDDYASAAGVPDMAAFDACIKKTDPIPRVEEGKELGAKLDVQGTPTIIINGWKLGHPPNEQELDGMVKKILAGKSPVDGKS